MANKSYLNIEDEELLNPENQSYLEDDMTPYDSVSSRPRLEEESPPMQEPGVLPPEEPMAPVSVPPPMDRSSQVMESIRSRRPDIRIKGSTYQQPPLRNNFQDDPLMKQFDEGLGDLNDFRHAKVGADFISNAGLAMSQAAQGANDPKQNVGLYDNMNKQNSELSRSVTGDMDRRSRIINAIENRKMREGVAAENRLGRTSMYDYRESNRDDNRKERHTRYVADRFDKMNKLITSEIASGKGVFGIAAKNKQSIENAEALLKGELDPNDLDSRQVYELAKVVDRVLSQGSPTVSGTSHLDIVTARRWLNQKMEKMSNERKGAQAGSFVTSISHTLEREKEMANKQIKSAQKKMLASFSDLESEDPDKWSEIMKEQGLIPFDGNPEIVDRNVPGATPKSTGMVKVQAPDGSIRAVPENRLNEAISAGGKRVN